jgi:T5orf172 domain
MPPLPAGSTDTMRLVYAKLLVAMSEAPTKSDTMGYIYMFWQTDEKQTDAEMSAAASIVSGAKSQSQSQSQRAHEAVLEQRFFQTSANAAKPASRDRTIFLKIGRAANVHQRMAQWQSQCGYNVSLLRYYPHNAAEEAVKVRYVGKVERLVHLHLEMLGKRFNRQCRCGTEHKEWFQVDANPREVRSVDDIIRQWVAWCDGKFGAAAG